VSAAVNETGSPFEPVSVGTPNEYSLIRTAEPTSAFQEGQDYEGLVFGVIANPTLVVDQTASVVPGQVVDLGHRYTPSTTGTVSFDLLEVSAVPGSSTFSPTLWTDRDCDGELDLTGGDPDVPVPSTPLDVTADGPVPTSGWPTFSGPDPDVCLIVRTSVSAAAPDGAALAYDIRAETDLPNADTEATLPIIANRDVITVTGDGAVTLLKEVCNQTEAGTCNDGDFGFTSTGSPGDILEYRLTFENPSAEPVTDITILDTTPSFTSLSGTTPVFVVTNPAAEGGGVLTCTPSTQSAGDVGDISWDCPGAMAPGARGVMGFTVQINP
jgi:uncharacterized repeat protein (TIGR01451 family)